MLCTFRETLMFSMDTLLLVFLPLSASLFSRIYGQTTNATCRPNFDWMFNSQGQNPCLVAAYAESACDPLVSWNVAAVPNSTVTYAGPDSSTTSQCTCSSVTFCLLSACAYCQGAGLPDWLDWIADCPADDVSNGQFPLNTPDGTGIPAWAYQQVVNRFNVSVAENIADQARPTPTSSTSGSSSSTSSSNMPTSNPKSHSTPIGPIVGGVVGGVLGLALLLIAGNYLYRRSKSRPNFQSTAPINELPPAPPADPEKLADSASMLHSPWSPPPPETESTSGVSTVPPMRPMRLYNPDDPATFPPNEAEEYNVTRVHAFLNANRGFD